MFDSNRPFRLGLVINPYAGIGGAMALKGSDGLAIREQALAMGAQKQANHKTSLALAELLGCKDKIQIFTAAGEMGQQVAQELGFNTQVVYWPQTAQTEANDTLATVEALQRHKLDLLLFAGGDGTARNVCAVLAAEVPALGVPAGCKIHSGVYAITPKSAGKVVAMLVSGELVSLTQAEVRDIDEEKFRQGKVLSRYFGQMLVPAELHYVQAVKMGGKESQQLVLADIAAQIIEMMEEFPEHLFVMGSGSTVAAIMQELGQNNSLLGVDVLQQQQLLAQDVNAAQLQQLLVDKPAKLVITLIGGQGHILGRGNQQLSPQVIRQIGRENIIVVASKSKLHSLKGKPLIVDSGDPQLDIELAGLIAVICGFHDQVLYPIG